MGLLVGGVFEVEPGDLLVPHLHDWSFDGVDDYVEVPYSSLLHPDDLTIALWLMFLSGSINRRCDFLSTHPNGAGYAFFKNSDNRVYWSTYDEGAWRDLPTLTVFTANRWYFVAGTLTSSPKQKKVYVNGVLENQHNYAYVKSNVNVRIGTHYRLVSTWFFNGIIGMVLIYGRALADEEVQQMYSGGVASASGLALLLDATFWDGSKFVDLSGNGNHGYPYGGVQRVPAEQRFVLRVKGRFSDGIPRLAVPGRCTYMTNCSWRENWSDSPLFVELQPGRNLILVETLG